MGEIFAVLAGDLVGSSGLSSEQLDHVRASLRLAADEVRGWKRGLVRGSPDFFRGDAWQMLLAEPKWALRAAVFLRASLIGGELADTRVVIGIGTVDSVNTTKISLSTGQAFTLAGEGLDGLTQHFRMSIELPKEASELAAWVSVVGRLCGMAMGHWTSRQAQIIRIALAPGGPTQAEIAERLDPPISKQAVAKSMAGADWHGLRLALKQFEATSWREVCCRRIEKQPKRVVSRETT